MIATELLLYLWLVLSLDVSAVYALRINCDIIINEGNEGFNKLATF